MRDYIWIENICSTGLGTENWWAGYLCAFTPNHYVVFIISWKKKSFNENVLLKMHKLSFGGNPIHQHQSQSTVCLSLPFILPYTLNMRFNHWMRHNWLVQWGALAVECEFGPAVRDAVPVSTSHCHSSTPARLPTWTGSDARVHPRIRFLSNGGKKSISGSKIHHGISFQPPGFVN